jgi:hypothetical protein
VPSSDFYLGKNVSNDVAFMKELGVTVTSKNLSQAYKVGTDMLNDYARMAMEGDNCPINVIDKLWNDVRSRNSSLKIQMDLWIDAHEDGLRRDIQKYATDNNMSTEDVWATSEYRGFILMNKFKGITDGLKTIEEMNKTKIENLTRSQKILQIEHIISACHQQGWMEMEAILREPLKDQIDKIEDPVIKRRITDEIHAMSSSFYLGPMVLDFLRDGGNNIVRLNGQNIAEETMKKAIDLQARKRQVSQLANEKESDLKYGWVNKRNTEHARKTMKKKKEVISVSHIRKNSRMNKRIIF